VEETTDADWESAFCRGSIRRAWRLDATGWQPEDAEKEPFRAGGELRGMLWLVGLFRFHVTGDRKRVLFQYQVGPRYGRGMTLRVAGQGRRGRLLPTGGCCWIS
jgi:hypothetical protein